MSQSAKKKTSTKPSKKTSTKPSKKTSKKPSKPASSFRPGADPLAVIPAAVTSIVPGLSGWKAEPAGFDVAVAEEHEQAYAERLDAIAPDRIRILRLDADAVCGVALTVHALTQAPPLLARYEAAAKAGEFLLANLDALRALPFIVLDARRRAKAAGAFASGAKISSALDEASAEVEARMQKVTEHYFWDDPDLGPTVRALHPGRSYQDRAYDLLGYADIYSQRHDVVSKDPVHYRAKDMADARRLAGEILAALNAALSPEARAWYDTTQRAWTLLELVYNEVRELGLRFLRCDPLRDQRFPSLYVVGRAPTVRRSAKKDASAGKPASGTTEATATTDGHAAGGEAEAKTEAAAPAAGAAEGKTNAVK